jgi:hypothetical protein
MSSISILGDTSGSVLLQAPAVSGSTTLTLPATTGTLSINGPAFLAYKTSNQSISSGVDTKVTFDSEVFDTNNCFASSAFTPTVAGYYQINVTLSITTPPSNTYASPILRKNGSAYLSGTEAQIFTSSYAGCGFSTLVYCNGTTDYLEISVTAGANVNIYGQALPGYTFFSGYLARGA